MCSSQSQRKKNLESYLFLQKDCQLKILDLWTSYVIYITSYTRWSMDKCWNFVDNLIKWMYQAILAQGSLGTLFPRFPSLDSFRLEQGVIICILLSIHNEELLSQNCLLGELHSVQHLITVSVYWEDGYNFLFQLCIPGWCTLYYW